MTKIVSFLEVGANFDLAPTEAIAVFVDKGLKPSFAWQDMLGAEHDAAFTVAKMMDTDLLQTVQAKLTKALESGSTLADFKKQLIPDLQAAGWWGKKDVIDPITGLVEKAQLGSASRLENIFRSNMQSAYATGQWDSITRTVKALPYLMYDSVDDHRVRPEHAARDGEVHPVNSDFWKTHYPPNGWNCRCGVIQLSEEDVKDMGVTPIKTPTIKTRKWVNPRTGVVMDMPIDTDPGWNHNPGIARQAKLAQLSDDKASKMLAKEAAAVRQVMRKREAARAAYLKKVDAKGLERKLRATVTINANQKPARSAWGKTPRVQIAANERTVKNHEQYSAAKAGDNDAAIDLVLGVITAEYIAGLQRQIGTRDPLILPIHALETESVNPIPLAMAEYISIALGQPVNLDILQANRVSHTSASGYHRLATPALFDGDVIPGAEYLIVDDFVGQGGTLANLRGFIEQNGGRVIGFATLTGQRRSAILGVSKDTLNELRQKHDNLEEWWKEVFGYGFDLLTQSEARYLIRSPDADTIRAGITAAARAGNKRDDADDD